MKIENTLKKEWKKIKYIKYKPVPYLTVHIAIILAVTSIFENLFLIQARRPESWEYERLKI